MSRILGRFFQFFDRTSQRRIRQRKHHLESLERRDLLAAAIWNNPVYSLDVTGDQPARVSALDALRVINWLNDSSRPRELPNQVDFSTVGQYVDTNCDGRVSAIDALRVINHLNTVGAGVVGGFSTDGGSFASAACSPQLLEGTGFSTELERILIIPEGRPSLQVKFQAPEFDASSRLQIRDAFEITITDAHGNVANNPLSSTRAAALNWTEGFDPILAHGATLELAPPGEDSKASFDLSEFAPGTEIHVLTRLINNDQDDNSSVIIRGYEFVQLPASIPQENPAGQVGSRSGTVSAFDIRQLTDITGQFEVDYGRTSLSIDQARLVSRPRLTNIGDSAVVGPVVAVFENFSESNVFLLRPDGILQDGRPFIDLTDQMSGLALISGQSINGPEIQFQNGVAQRFNYRLSIYGQVNSGPGGFRSQPVTSIEAGKQYRYDAQARPTLDSPLSYSIVGGPEELTIDPQSGRLHWQTQLSDVGSHQVILRATDEFGMFVEQ